MLHAGRKKEEYENILFFQWIYIDFVFYLIPPPPLDPDPELLRVLCELLLLLFSLLRTVVLRVELAVDLGCEETEEVLLVPVFARVFPDCV